MVKHQIHFSRKFYKDKKTGYWISTDYPRIRAHRWVWISVHKIIPEGYHIHHINENKSDNRIENLELIHGSRHQSLHGQSLEKRKRAKEMADKYRPLTKAWHASEEGRTWHKYHGMKVWKNKKTIKLRCQLCKLIFKTKTYHQTFCSNKCKSKWRRDSGIDNIKYVCENCEKEFEKNKYAKTKFCSKNCGLKFSWKKRKKL